MAERYTVLDSWRGIAACIIAIFHFRINSHFLDLAFLDRAGLFVDFFFVLSGFVIFANYKDRLREGFGFWRFMFLRLGRLYPLHFFILWVHIGWEILQIFVPFLAGVAKFEPFGQPGESLDFIIANFFLIHALGFYDYGSVPLNGASWSISVEFYAYAVFAFILIAAGKYMKFAVGAVCFGALVFLCTQGGMNSTLKLGFIRCLYGFGAGALLWLAYENVAERVSKIAVPNIVWSGIELLLCLGLVLALPHATGSYAVAMIAFFALMIFVFSFERGIVSKILKGRGFVALGALSYSVYMTHSFIGGKMASAVQLADQYTPYDLLSVINGKEQLGGSIWQGDFITLLYMAVVICVSIFTYSLIEKPARIWSRKLVDEGFKFNFLRKAGSV